jgi:hypothetical protein
MIMSKPILCLDFDGVIHSYTSGWQGAGIISDPPVPGAIDFLREVVKHFRVMIFSSRSNQPGGQVAMRTWLGDNIIAVESDIIMQDPPWFTEIEWPTEKPPALVTIDDRAITFTGVWPSIENLKNFKPWNKK